MFILYAVLAGVLLAVPLGGNINRLSAIKLHWWPIMLAGLVFQVVLFAPAVAERVGDLGPILYVGSTLAVLVAVLRNRTIPGLPVVIAGGLSNLTAIVANGGFMPASLSAMESIGKHPPEGYSNSALVLHPQLPFLTDIFAMPRWLPFANVFSVGDVLIGAGVMWAVLAIMRGWSEESAAPGNRLWTDAVSMVKRRRLPAPPQGVAPVQPSLVSGTESTDGSFAPWDSRRSLRHEEHTVLR